MISTNVLQSDVLVARTSIMHAGKRRNPLTADRISYVLYIVIIELIERHKCSTGTDHEPLLP